MNDIKPFNYERANTKPMKPVVPQPIKQPVDLDLSEVIAIIAEQNGLLEKFIEKEEKPIEINVNLEII